MAQLFNSSLTGSFSLSSCLTRAISTVGANFDTGTIPISINSTPLFSLDFNVEPLPIRSVYLNIHSIAKYATGTLAIILNTDIGSTQFRYPLSALVQSKYTGISHSKSQYWQGFYFEDTDLGDASLLSIGLSCSTSDELFVLGKANNFNRYIIPVSAWNYLSSFNAFSDIIISGHLYPNMSVVSASNIVCDVAANVNNINITNGGIFKISSPGNITAKSQILVSAGGTLSASGSVDITLHSASKLIGLDTSTIILSGDNKTPYSFLTTEVAAGDTQILTREDISLWDVGDSVLLLPNSDNADTTEAGIIATIASNRADLTVPAVTSHHSLQHPLTFNMFGNFLAAPVCNITRNLNVHSTDTAFIRAEDSCNLNIKNTNLTNLGGSTLSGGGAINIFNTQAIVENCVIAGNTSTKNGIYINAATASGYILNNNIIYDTPLYAVHVEGVFAKNVTPSFITNNVCLNSDTGLCATDLRNVAVTGNMFVRNTNRGAFIENALIAVPVLKFEDNWFYKNINEGAIVTNLLGDTKNNTFVFNSNKGVHLKSTSDSISISATNINSAFNGKEGIYIQSIHVDGSPVTVTTANTLTNNKGIVLDNIYGSVSSVSATSNTLTGVDIFNCFNGPLNLYNFNISQNNKNIIYRYPANFNCNFYPTYLTNSKIGAPSDETCIVLYNTNCEKFVVEQTTFNSTGPNITLVPSTTNLIEGSYIFSGCTFSLTKFNEIATKYQDNILNESGFAVMYENNSANIHQKFTAAGRIAADTAVFHDNIYQISEKLTPTSNTIPLKSSSKIIAIDNADNSNPPIFAPTSLYVSVWIKKDNTWGSNSNPELVVAANPILNINEETIVDTHSSSTTNWVQLTSVSPVATANLTRGAVELFVRCLGSSGGSINIDSWQANYVRV